MLTQLDTLKKRLGIEIVDLKDDELLTRLINHAGGRFDLQCNRKFHRNADAVEEFPADETEILPACYPVESVASFHLKDSEAAGWVAQTGYDFLILRECVVRLSVALGFNGQRAKMTYAGGYRMPGEIFVPPGFTLPSEIESCAIEQCAYWYQHRNRLGLTATTSDGGSLQQFAQLDLLPHVKQVLLRYERIRL